MIKTTTENFNVYSTTLRNDAGERFLVTRFVSQFRDIRPSSGQINGVEALSAIVAEKFNAGLFTLGEAFDIMENGSNELKKSIANGIEMDALTAKLREDLKECLA